MQLLAQYPAAHQIERWIISDLHSRHGYLCSYGYSMNTMRCLPLIQ